MSVNKVEVIRNMKKVVVTGGVAVGKSSIIKQLKQHLDEQHIPYIIIPEYIDVLEDAGEMLQKYLRKEMKAIDFQWYVTKYYENYIMSLPLNGDELLIFERVLDDAVICFANNDNKNDEISTEDLLKLYNYARDIDSKYNFPTYFDLQNTTFITIKTNDKNIDGNIINNIINNSEYQKTIIGLFNSAEECYQRMLSRNRPGESNAYTISSINSFNTHYMKLYQSLMVGEKIRFVSLGKFSPEF